MANGMTSTKRFITRMALATGSTLATIIGAQSLVVMDKQDQNETADAALEQNAVPQQDALANAAELAVQKAPPSIAILRQPGQNSASVTPNILIIPHNGTQDTAANAPAVNNSGSQTVVTAPVIQPPAPVAIQPPAAQVFVPRTQSSR